MTRHLATVGTTGHTAVSEAPEEWFVITAEGRALLERLAATAESAPQGHPEQAALLARLGDLDVPDSDGETDASYTPGPDTPASS